MILDELEKRLTLGAHLNLNGGELRRFTALIRKIFERERERLREDGLVLLAIPAELARQIAEVEVVP